jgi:hypothetical protein
MEDCILVKILPILKYRIAILTYKENITKSDLAPTNRIIHILYAYH